MKKKYYLYISIGVIICLIIVFSFMFVWGGKEKQIKSKKLISGEISEEIEENKLEYIFYYPSPEGKLIEEKRQILKRKKIKDQIKSIIKELFNGPKVDHSEQLLNPFSKNLKLNNFYLVNNTILVLDVSREIHTNLLGGSKDEILTIYSIVNTICSNFEFIKAVQLIVDGREMETLSGHIYVSYPLRFNGSWVQ